MKHYNWARLPFADGRETARTRYTQYVRQDWTFFMNMEYYGSNVGRFFVVRVPREIVPIPQDADDPESPLVLPAGSFNVVSPFRIVPVVREQEGSLIFGHVSCGRHRYEFLQGREHILASEENSFYRNHEIVFAALLRERQSIVVRVKVWKEKGETWPMGSKDRMVVFTPDSHLVFSRSEYKEFARRWAHESRARAEREEAQRKIDGGEWKLA